MRTVPIALAASVVLWSVTSISAAEWPMAQAPLMTPWAERTRRSAARCVRRFWCAFRGRRRSLKFAGSSITKQESFV